MLAFMHLIPFLHLGSLALGTHGAGDPSETRTAHPGGPEAPGPYPSGPLPSDSCGQWSADMNQVEDEAPTARREAGGGGSAPQGLSL